MSVTITPDDLACAAAIWEALEQAATDGSGPVPRLAQALAEARTTDGQVIARLRAALAWYGTATQVTSWGYEEEEDIGGLARETLAATPDGQGEALVEATREMLYALGIAQEAEKAHAALSARLNEEMLDDADAAWQMTGVQVDATRRMRDEALAEVEQARQRIAELLARVEEVF
jgi:hypothetical protein